jgi:hypothetical protein
MHTPSRVPNGLITLRGADSRSRSAPACGTRSGRCNASEVLVVGRNNVRPGPGFSRRSCRYVPAEATGENVPPLIGIPILVTVPSAFRKRPPMEMNGPEPRIVPLARTGRGKEGQCDGTILVDLERHRPIDLLPDRESESRDVEGSSRLSS